MKRLSHKSMMRLLQKRIKMAGSVIKFAQQNGMSRIHVYAVLKGDADFGPSMLKAFNARREYVYYVYDEEQPK